jgi:hypothetical protein
MAWGWDNIRLDDTDVTELGLGVLSADGRGNDDIITGQPRTLLVIGKEKHIKAG